MPPTISDVAKRAGVSPNTVSRVINGALNVKPENLDRINQAIQELGYVPNPIARSLRSKRSRWLALVVPDVTDTHWHAVARGVEDAAQNRGYTVLLCNTDDNPDKQRRYLDVAVGQSVAGVIIASSNPDGRHLAPLRTNQIPTVCINRRVSGWNVDTVYSDARSAARALTRHLIQVGHRRIAVLSGPTYHSAVQDRFAGYHIALAEAGIPADPRLIKSGEFQAASGEMLTYQVLDEGLEATAILAVSKTITIGVIRAMGKRGLRIPQDMALVSFGDLEQGYFPFLTCVLEPGYEMGANAAQLLFTRLEADNTLPPRQVVLPTRFLVRYSCGRFKNAGPTLVSPQLEEVQPVLTQSLTAEELKQYQHLLADAATPPLLSDESPAPAGSNIHRLLAAFRRQSPDRLPYLLLWRPGQALAESVLDGKPYPAGAGQPASPETHVAFARRLGADAVVCRYSHKLEHGSIRSWSDLDRLEPPSLAEHLTRLERYLQAALGTGIGVALGFSACLYESLQAVTGPDLAGETRQLFQTLNNILVEQQERLMRAVLDRFANDLAFVVFHRPALPAPLPAGKAALLAEFLPGCALPLLYSPKAYDKQVLMHVGPELDQLLGVLHEAGVNAIYRDDLTLAETVALRKQWAGRLALSSSLPTDLLSRTSEEIARSVQEYWTELGRAGGYVLSIPNPEGLVLPSGLMPLVEGLARARADGPAVD